MNFLEANNVEFRKTESLPEDVVYSDLEPMSSCQLECDIDFKDIVNRSVNMNDGRLPGLEAIWAEELKRCKNSQELLKIKGVASQERPAMSSTEMDDYWMQRLFDGLSKLNVTLDNESNTSEELNAEQVLVSADEQSNDAISQTIEGVISDSTIHQTIEDVINSSQNNIISQTIEDVVNESQKKKKHSKVKHLKRKEHNSSRKRLNFKNSFGEGTSRVRRNINTQTNTDESTHSNESRPNDTSLYADACTQTESLDSADESMDSVFGLGEAIDDIICDCDSDECCDQCCDRGSDQCECDCERCEFEKCKRIPQLDGAFDSDDSDVEAYSPKYNDDSDDSDFDVGSKKKKKSPKKTAKRGKGKRGSPPKKAKSYASGSEDDFADSYKSSPKRRSTARARRSPSPAPSDDDIFESSSGRKVKPTKNLPNKMWDKFKPKDKKKRASSPLQMSFSESDGSDKETSFLSSFKSLTQTKNDDRSRRSLTPYLDEEPEEEKPPKTKPGPRSSKPATGPPPGPKSSKTATISRPGPKSSKPGSKPGPKSSKRRQSHSSDDIEIIDLPSTSRSRRSNAKSSSYLDIEPLNTEKLDIPKGKGKRSGGRPKGNYKEFSIE